LHIDDPVGAVAVHCMNGIWGTIAVGLFATTSAPGYAIADSAGRTISGLFYGGGGKLLGLQLLGFVTVAAWTAVTITIAFLVIRKVIGLRVTREEEMAGLDSTEHGLPSAYGGFAMLPETVEYDASYIPKEVPAFAAEGVVPAAAAGNAGASGADVSAAPVFVTGEVPPAEAVTVQKMPSFEGREHKFTKVEIICKEARLEALKNAMVDIGIAGMTVSHVLGCGEQKGKPEYYRGVQVEASLLPKVQVDIVVSKVPVRNVIETAKKVLYTGHFGDGKIFVYDVENVVKVRTGEEGYDALQDVE
ncbi:MAG: adenylate cyclase, partial [Lachnospiraceae bacterium]|nr:adenylate cyclase [Lachnospiraceae bacterium]